MIVALITLNSSCKKDSNCDYTPQGKVNVCDYGGYTKVGFIDGVSIGQLKYDPVHPPTDNFFVLSPGNHILKWNTINIPSEIHTMNFTVEKCKIVQVNI